MHFYDSHKNFMARIKKFCRYLSYWFASELYGQVLDRFWTGFGLVLRVSAGVPRWNNGSGSCAGRSPFHAKVWNRGIPEAEGSDEQQRNDVVCELFVCVYV